MSAKQGSVLRSGVLWKLREGSGSVVGAKPGICRKLTRDVLPDGLSRQVVTETSRPRLHPSLQFGSINDAGFPCTYLVDECQGFAQAPETGITSFPIRDGIPYSSQNAQTGTSC